MHLVSQCYGKERVRVLRIVRRVGGVQSVHEVEASVSLEGDFSAAYLEGDNGRVVPTDTMKNTVHILAQKYLSDVIEDFGLALADHFLKRYAQISQVKIELLSSPWDRYSTMEGDSLPHTFLGRTTARPMTRVSATRENLDLWSGVKDVLILNSTNSAFVGYPKCDYTTLPETKDRILATKMAATWKFTSGAIGHSKTNKLIVSALLDTFAKEFSPSVQNTLFLMGSAALAATPDISDIQLTMPNKHYLPISFKPFGLENDNEIFLPTDEPHGQIEARVSR